MNSILIIEDKDAIREPLTSYFSEKGWEVLTSNPGNEALQMVEDFKLDLVVLDLAIPNLSKKDIGKIKKAANVPFVFIAEKSFRMKEAVARIYGLQQGTESLSKDAQRLLYFNDHRFAVNVERKEVFLDGHFVSLTFTEFKILEVLILHPKKTFSRSDLSYEVYGYRHFGDGRTIDVHIKNIRKKIENDPKQPRYIMTLIRAGYKFNYEPDPS